MSEKPKLSVLYMKKYWFTWLPLLWFAAPYAMGQEDKSHFSKAFQKEKAYRIFLPADYNSTKKKYPVIYYFHGNKGDHRFSLDGVAELVKNSQAILVAWDGRSSNSDRRPYNIGYHSNINYENQIKDYFPELVAHIDTSYRTITDRASRAIIGHSMGGFMSFFIAGKYPHLVGTAVNSKGSPEFFVGYPKNHTLYSMRHMFLNLHGIRLRFYNGAECELKYLNHEVHQGALQEPGLDYDYKIFDGTHKLMPDQFADAFKFARESLKKPVPLPVRWHHADLYPNFEVWGYKVESNLAEPGFIVLKGVTKNELTVQTRKWLPTGNAIPGTKIKIVTAPLYIPGKRYTLVDYNRNTRTVSYTTSDTSGRISFDVDHHDHTISISESEANAGIAFQKHTFNGKGRFLETGKEGTLKISLFNLSNLPRKGLRVELATNRPEVTILNHTIESETLPASSGKTLNGSFRISVKNAPPADGSPNEIKFKLKVTDPSGRIWEEDFEAPVFYDVAEFDDIGIDDGDSEVFGSGNGNNIAEPGETIAIYQVSNRTRLYHDDPFVINEKLIDELQPDKWGDGYALSSVVQISKDCPPGHRIRFLASYENKTWKTINRKVTWGYFYVTVGEKK